MSAMKMILAAASIASTVGLGSVSKADEMPRYRDVDGRMMHARMELEQRLATCGDFYDCRAYAWRNFRREMEEARRDREWRKHEWREHEARERARDVEWRDGAWREKEPCAATPTTVTPAPGAYVPAPAPAYPTPVNANPPWFNRGW